MSPASWTVEFKGVLRGSVDALIESKYQELELEDEEESRHAEK